MNASEEAKLRVWKVNIAWNIPVSIGEEMLHGNNNLFE